MRIKEFFKNLFKKKTDQSVEIEDVDGDVDAKNIKIKSDNKSNDEEKEVAE